LIGCVSILHPGHQHPLAHSHYTPAQIASQALVTSEWAAAGEFASGAFRRSIAALGVLKPHVARMNGA